MPCVQRETVYEATATMKKVKSVSCGSQWEETCGHGQKEQEGERMGGGREGEGPRRGGACAGRWWIVRPSTRSALVMGASAAHVPLRG